MNERRCPYCQQVFQPVPYHPQQRICSRPACQRQRRRDYHRQKIASDPVYRQVCRDSPRNWRQAHPGYWKQYRQTHPQQVERNHQQQWRRDQKRRLANLLANNNLAFDLKHSAAEVWLLGPTARRLLRNTHAATGTTLRPSVRACARSLASARTRQSFSCLTNTVAS
jgi:hypothetical protein